MKRNDEHFYLYYVENQVTISMNRNNR